VTPPGGNPPLRRAAVLCAALVAAVPGVTAVASAVRAKQTVTVTLESDRAGTRDKPRSVGRLTVTIATTPVRGEPPFATRRAVIHLDRNLVFGTSRFAGCRRAKVQTDDTKCPPGSKVGTGSARASVFSGRARIATVTPTVSAYNGPRGRRIFLLVEEPTFKVRSIMVGTLKADSGRYARKLDVAIPRDLQAPLPGLVVTLTRFTANVGGTRKGTPYVALRGCAGGRLRFKGDFFYTDNTRKSAATTARCRRA
jgi:hypothetical protein